MNLSLLVISLMGVVSGVFGGILRDVLCNKIPSMRLLAVKFRLTLPLP